MEKGFVNLKFSPDVDVVEIKLKGELAKLVEQLSMDDPELCQRLLEYLAEKKND